MTNSLIETISSFIHELLVRTFHERTIRTLVIDFIEDLLIKDC